MSYLKDGKRPPAVNSLTRQSLIIMVGMANTWKYASFAQIPVDHLNPLLDRQFVHGDQGMLARLFLRKGCIVPRHSHVNEQITYVIEGALKFVLGEGDEVVVRSGELLVIPPNLPHSAEAIEDTIDIDVFAPPRADWIDGSDAYLRK